MSRFAFFYESVGPLFAEASGRGREWFDTEDGYDTRRLPKLKDPEHDRRVRLLMNRRCEAKRPDLYRELHRRASEAWMARDPQHAKRLRTKRKRKWAASHPDAVAAQQRRAYLRRCAMQHREPKFRTLFERALYLKGVLRLDVDQFELLKRHLCEAVHEAERRAGIDPTDGK